MAWLAKRWHTVARLKCRAKHDHSISFTCWQFDPKAPRPVWVCRVAHNIDGGEHLTMINHLPGGPGVIDIKPKEWFLRDNEGGGVMVCAEDEFERAFELLPE